MSPIGNRKVLRKSRKAWEAHLRKWEASGQGVRAFCQRAQLSEASFYYWRRRLRDAGRQVAEMASDSKDAKASAFVPLRVSPSIAYFEIDTVQRTVRVPPGFDPDSLRELLRVMEDSPCG